MVINIQKWNPQLSLVSFVFFFHHINMNSFNTLNPIFGIKEEEVRENMREYYASHEFEPRRPWSSVIRAAYARKHFVWD